MRNAPCLTGKMTCDPRSRVEGHNRWLDSGFHAYSYSLVMAVSEQAGRRESWQRRRLLKENLTQVGQTNLCTPYKSQWKWILSSKSLL